MELDKDQLQIKVQEKGQIALNAATKPFKEWERMRNPLSGWTRVGLALISPFVLWSNSLILLVLFVAAIFTHPYWFPQFKDTKPHPDVMTKLIDIFQIWTQKAPKEEQLLFYIPGIAIAVPYVCFMWSHSLFWGLFFLSTGASYKVLFAKWLLNNDDYQPKKEGATKADTSSSSKDKPIGKEGNKKEDSKEAA